MPPSSGGGHSAPMFHQISNSLHSQSRLLSSGSQSGGAGGNLGPDHSMYTYFVNPLAMNGVGFVSVVVCVFNSSGVPNIRC